jgi:hypothetical protein
VVLTNSHRHTCQDLLLRQAHVKWTELAIVLFVMSICHQVDVEQTLSFFDQKALFVEARYACQGSCFLEKHTLYVWRLGFFDHSLLLFCRSSRGLDGWSWAAPTIGEGKLEAACRPSKEASVVSGGELEAACRLSTEGGSRHRA